MQTARSTLKLKMPVQAILPQIPQKQVEECKQILKLLQTKYPLCFAMKAKSLAIGIHKEIIATEKETFSKQQIHRFFRRYCSDKRYKKLLIEGKQRFNLDGTPASLVTKEEVPPKTDKSFKSKKS